MAACNDTTGQHSPESVISHSQLINGISHDALKRYVDVRRKIDKDIDFIMVFTSILSQYKVCSDDELLVDLYSIGYVNQMLHDKVLDIIEELDKFLLLGEAMRVVMEEATEEA